MSDLRTILTASPMIPQNTEASKKNCVVQKVKDSELLDPNIDNYSMFSHPDAFTMKVNTKDNEVDVCLSLPPKFEGDNLKTTVENGTLKIEGEFNKHTRRESDHGCFESSLSQSIKRSVLLPEDCEGDKMHREIKGDNLMITIPRKGDNKSPHKENKM